MPGTDSRKKVLWHLFQHLLHLAGQIRLDGAETLTLFDEMRFATYSCVEGRDTHQAIARVFEAFDQKSFVLDSRVCDLDPGQAPLAIE